jgi:hypothetical protein
MMAKHRKPTDPTLRRVAAGTVIVPAGLGLATLVAAPAFAVAPDGKGVPNAAEVKHTGTPDNPNGFGSVVSQRALNDHDIGTHSSAFAPGQQSTRPIHGGATGRLGVGNVARNDADMADALGMPNTGAHPSNHADIIGPVTGYDPNNRPGTHETDEETATG